MYNESFKKYLMGYGSGDLGGAVPDRAGDHRASTSASCARWTGSMAEPLPTPRFNPWPATIFTVLLRAGGAVPAADGRGAPLLDQDDARDFALGELWSLPDSLYLGNFAEVLWATPPFTSTS
jgi:hypothetical protein